MKRTIEVSRQRRRVLQAGVAGSLACSMPLLAQGTQTLRIGFQKGGGLLGVAKAQGRLEPVLAAIGWKVAWTEFPAGPQLLEALDAGAVDFGYTGAPPPVFAQAAGKDVVYVGAEPFSSSVEAIVVKPASPLHDVKSLKGRRVAVQRGSSAHFLLVVALEAAGLRFADIEPVYLAPADARAAFESDRVDAWSIWDPYLAAVQDASKVRVLADYTGLPHSNAFYESSRAFVSRSPRPVAAVLEELARLGAWASAHPAEVAQALAPQLGLRPEVVETWQRRTRYGVRPVDAAIVANQQKVADAFLAQKLIPKPIDVADFAWPWQRA